MMGAVVRRKFTPAQANATLPLVRRIVADILRTGRGMRALASRPLRTDEARDAYAAGQEQMLVLMHELEAIGCDYKDFGFEHGLVDFPGVIGGRDVLLCWRSDEPRVEWYHAPEAGYAGRRRIPVSLLEVRSSGSA
jgi:hypothetical protein